MTHFKKRCRNDDDESSYVRKITNRFALILGITILLIAYCLLFTGCQFIPELARTVDSIATDDAIQKDTDVYIQLEVKNKEPLRQEVPHAP